MYFLCSLSVTIARKVKKNTHTHTTNKVGEEALGWEGGEGRFADPSAQASSGHPNWNEISSQKIRI